MSFRDFDVKVADYSSSITRNSNIFESGDSIDEELSIPIPEGQRGVRPRLEMRCPITGKNLIEGSFSKSESFATHASAIMSADDEGYVPAVVDDEHDACEIMQTQPARLSSRQTSSYCQLAASIVNFQKMVANLEEVLENAGRSPEFQWKSRILVRSVQEANRDIRIQLQESMSTKQNIAYTKLNRDYRRAQHMLQTILKDQEHRQQAEVSLLFASNKEESKNKEEFFDRMMREREQEVKNINTSLQKVNKIYEELAQLVDNQQELVDKVAENLENSKTNTRSGLGYVQNPAAVGICGVSVTAESMGIKPTFKRTTMQNSTTKLRVNEDFKWTMPFETISDDVLDVQQDIMKVMKVAKTILNELQENIQQSTTASSKKQTVIGCCTSTFDCSYLPGMSVAKTENPKQSSRVALLELKSL